MVSIWSNGVLICSGCQNSHVYCTSHVGSVGKTILAEIMSKPDWSAMGLTKHSCSNEGSSSSERTCTTITQRHIA